MTIPPIRTNSISLQAAGMSLADYAREILTDKIVCLELEPGTAIVERDLLNDLQIGRTPVREALQYVAGMGLLCRLPHIGMYVCEVTQESLRDTYELKSSLDGEIAHLATLRADPNQIDAVVAAAKAIEAAYSQRDLTGFTHASRNFAYRMAEAANNLHFLELTPRVYNLDARFTWIADREMGNWDVLGCGIVEMALSISGVMVRKLPQEARLLADLHTERRYSYLASNLHLAYAKVDYSVRA